MASTVDMDRISNLPDSLLCHILSFLPIEASVATSLLSRRWRHLWKHLQAFDFKQKDQGEFNDDGSFRRFAVLVNGVLALRKERDIRKFCLSCFYTDTSSFYEHSLTCWILATIGPHLQHLDLHLSAADSGYCLPHCVLTCTSLVSLSLDGAIIIERISSVCLPALKTLKLHINRVSPIDRLLSGCPVLETLSLIFRIENAPELHVPSSLKRLIFADWTGVAIDELEIDTPALECLMIGMSSSRCRQFTVNNFHSVREAHLIVSHDFCRLDGNAGFILRLLRELYRTKFLFLSNGTTEYLLGAPIQDFPKFCCLLCLELDIPCFNSSFMINLLHNCHMLRVFKVHNFQTPSVQTSYPSGWTHPTSVPDCLISHLTNIEFRSYEGSRDEQAFTAYILQSGLVLKTVTIHFSSCLQEKYNIVKELCASTRGSTMCQLIFE